ncbi:PREDICTED: multivesicular body subunit 12A [Thamnophis sirtalis]|uniref:Multivesicular body subunit 12A n=1 Tax=Thamnophis sirtalis TaxID=35019 RepID=A0A6I9X9D5_9SAUR|nr:PREDICTED: multivesicular body subunit 12A [Thamnophis sirtalis]
MTVPLTGLGWTSSNVPVAGWIPITTTVEGAPANFGKGFAQKYGYYLCFTVSVDALNPTGDVLCDVVILSEKSPLPFGYMYIKEFLDLKTSVSKKKRLCIKLIPMGVAETAVCDVMLSSKSKVIPNYIRIGEISGFALWCKKEHINKPKPLPKPRSISLEMNQLSLETANVDSLSIGSKRQTTIKKNESIYDTSNAYGISAIDGVPFTLHPKFENNVTRGATALSIFKNFHIKSLADIEKEYDYSFVVERTAAARLPPTIS